MSDVPAHDQRETHTYVVRYPAHAPRPGDPHYVDFEHYHRRTRSAARCADGAAFGFAECRDEQGHPCGIDAHGVQSGLQLHHAHIEFAVQNAVDLAALETDYPGVSNPDAVGAWVESAANLTWLCAWHHVGPGGRHVAAQADWAAERYVRGLITG